MSGRIRAKLTEWFMPRYRKYTWRHHKIKVYPEDLWRTLPLVPFFWDSPTNLVVVVNKATSGREQTDVVCTWQLEDGNGDIVENDQSTFEYKKPYTLRLGNLRPHQAYKLSVILTDDEYSSPRIPIAYFTVKDRDEMYIQVLIGLIIIVAGVAIGFIARGCS